MHRRYRGFLSVAAACGLAVLVTSGSGTATAGIRDGDWSGSYTLPAPTQPVAIDVQVHNTTAVVALGAGHAWAQTVLVQRSGPMLRFALPGLPTPLRIVLHLQGGGLSGSVSQGASRGRVLLAPVRSDLTRFLGLYRSARGDLLIVSDYRRIGEPPWLLDVGTDGLRGLYQLGPARYAIGAGVSTQNPVAGSVQFFDDGGGLTRSLHGQAPERAVRLSFRQQEVQFASGRTTLAATLTLPGGRGPFPAVVLVHGAGPSLRDEDQNWVAFLAAHGIASLSVDKRGQGQSGGNYPGDLATVQLVNTLAGDAEAMGRFLATQSAIDTRKIGLFGGSQAGWIVPLAAAQARRIFSFAVILSGPVVSQGESDSYAGLTNQGNSTPSFTPSQIDAQVRGQGPSGFDPRPVLRTLRIPILWIYGGKDQNQPTRLDLPVLARLKAATHADFRWIVFEDANHGLIPTRHGLNSEAAAAPGLAPGFLAALETWLRAHALGG